MSGNVFRIWKDAEPHRGRREGSDGQAGVWGRRNEFLAGGISRMLLACGPRWGKDRLSIWLLLDFGIRLLEQRAGSGLIPRVHLWIVAPSRTLYRQSWRELRAYTKGLPRVIRETYKQIIVLDPREPDNDEAGILIECMSGWDPDQLSGTGIDAALVTEGAQLRDVAFEELAQRLTSPGRNGVLLANGTPHNSSGAVSQWYRRMFREGKEGRDDLLFVNEPSWDNPHLSKTQLGKILRAKQGGIPERKFAATFGAQLVEDGGGVFRRVRECSTLDMAKPGDGESVCAFLDLADVNDFNALSVFTCGHRPRELYLDRWNRTGWQNSKLRTASALRELSRTGVLGIDLTMDPYKKTSPYAEDLRAALPGWSIQDVTFSSANKKGFVETMQAALETNRVQLLSPRARDLYGETSAATQAAYHEMLDFVAVQLPTTIRYTHPEGGNDDTVIARITGHQMALDNRSRSRGQDVVQRAFEGVI